MADQKEGALSRWSRLKREAASPVDVETDEGVVEASTPAPVSPTQHDEEAPRAGCDAEPSIDVDSADLPDVDTLTYESDFTGFLRDGVPELVRRAALAKLWRSDPVMANLDGLNDYDEDYRIIAETNGPLMKLIEPEPREELALERHQRRPIRDEEQGVQRHSEIERRTKSSDVVTSEEANETEIVRHVREDGHEDGEA